MTEILLVITNLPDAPAAEKLAHRLIEKGAAACVNMLAPCISMYRWKGSIETSTEIPMLIKTTRDAYPLLEKMICEAHHYELPEIIAVPIATGLPAYLGWIENQATINKE